jgi:hypothetical protein
MNLKYPVTVRQAQRIVSKSYVPYEVRQEITHAINSRSGVGDRTTLSKLLARLAAQFGPNHILLSGSPESPSQESAETSGEYRPKDTAEVAPQSDNPSEDSDTHGGDGSSAMCLAAGRLMRRRPFAIWLNHLI